MTPKEILEAYKGLRESYRIELAEARACGYEFPSFEVWCGEVDPKEAAQERWARREEEDTLDLY